jgi:BMFP domain-containing protein YqiC
MEEIMKMLRAVINTQSLLREEIVKLRKDMNNGFKEAKENDIQTEKRLTNRIDKIGKSVAYLEDDAPTREEHEELERRVTTVEKKLAA